MKVFRLTNASLDLAVKGVFGYKDVYRNWLNKNIRIYLTNKKFKDD